MIQKNLVLKATSRDELSVAQTVVEHFRRTHHSTIRSERIVNSDKDAIETHSTDSITIRLFYTSDVTKINTDDAILSYYAFIEPVPLFANDNPPWYLYKVCFYKSTLPEEVLQQMRNDRQDRIITLDEDGFNLDEREIRQRLRELRDRLQ